MTRILRWSVWLTALFVVVTVAGLITNDAHVWVEAVDLVLFALGVVAMAVAFAVGLGRSRTEAVTMYGLFLGADGALPAATRRLHFVVMAVQIVVGLGAALLGGGGSMAFGVLVAQFGLGMMALEGATEGTFPPRSQPPEQPPLPSPPDKSA